MGLPRDWVFKVLIRKSKSEFKTSFSMVRFGNVLKSWDQYQNLDNKSSMEGQ